MQTGQRASSGTACLRSARRAMRWLVREQTPAGGWKALNGSPVGGLYKAAWAFALLGEARAAERALSYAKAHLLQPDGDFAPREPERPRLIHVHYPYANAYFVIGAQKVGRYDVAVPALRFLLSQQDAEHGGFYGQKAAAGQRAVMDTMSGGGAGLACLAAGRLDAAARVADWLARLVELQPSPDRFYCAMSPDGRLLTDFPPADAPVRVVETQQPDQTWYAIGLPFVLAVLLHQATGEARHAELARWCFDFQTRCVNPWDGPSSGKAAWACSILYRATGEKRYRDIALQVAGHFLDWQLPDGRYKVGGLAAYGGQAPDAVALTSADFDVTAEFALWLGLVASNLLARDAR